MADKLPWFKCFPSKLLGALAGMPPSVQLVYLIVLLRIYEHGEFCPDPPEAIARRAGFNMRVTASALLTLCSSGRLVLKDNGYFNPVAEAILKERRSKNEIALERSVKAARARWEKVKQKQGEVHAQSNAPALQTDAEEEGRRKKVRKNPPLPPQGGKRVAKPKAAKAIIEPVKQREDRGHVIPPDWQPAGRCLALGRQKGFTTAQINDMAEGMREWSRSNAHRKEARKTSWDDTFCNWIRRAEERQKEKPNGQHRSTGQTGDGSRNGFVNLAFQCANEIYEARVREAAEPVLPGSGSKPPTIDLLPEQPGEGGATSSINGGGTETATRANSGVRQRD